MKSLKFELGLREKLTDLHIYILLQWVGEVRTCTSNLKAALRLEHILINF